MCTLCHILGTINEFVVGIMYFMPWKSKKQVLPPQFLAHLTQGSSINFKLLIVQQDGHLGPHQLWPVTLPTCRRDGFTNKVSPNKKLQAHVATFARSSYLAPRHVFCQIPKSLHTRHSTTELSPPSILQSISLWPLVVAEFQSPHSTKKQNRNAIFSSKVLSSILRSIFFTVSLWPLVVAEFHSAPQHSTKSKPKIELLLCCGIPKSQVQKKQHKTKELLTRYFF